MSTELQTNHIKFHRSIIEIFSFYFSSVNRRQVSFQFADQAQIPINPQYQSYIQKHTLKNDHIMTFNRKYYTLTFQSITMIPYL